MESDVIVEGGVDRPGAEAVRNCKNDEHPKPIGKGKTQQGKRRKKYAAYRDDTRAELPRQLVRQEAGYGDDHRNDPHKRNGNV